MGFARRRPFQIDEIINGVAIETGLRLSGHAPMEHYRESVVLLKIIRQIRVLQCMTLRRIAFSNSVAKIIIMSGPDGGCVQGLENTLVWPMILSGLGFNW